MRRWLARELARREAGLAGFWPLSGLDDYGPYRRHASPAVSGPPGPDAPVPQGYTNVPSCSYSAGRPCYPLDGTFFLTCPADDAFNFDEASVFTVSVWFLQRGHGPASTYTPLVAKNATHNDNCGWVLASRNDAGHNSLRFDLCQDSLYRILVDADISEAIGLDPGASWHHAVVTFDGGGAAAGFDFYVDGRQVPMFVQQDSNFPGLMPHVAGNLLFGAAYYPGGIVVSSGTDLALVRVYRRRLPHDEVVSLYRRELAAPAWKKTLSFLPPKFAQTTPPVPTLFLAGHLDGNLSAPLFVGGVGGGTEPMPLVCKADPVPAGSGGLTLYESGGTEQGAVRGTTLFTLSEDPFTRGLPLFVGVPDTGDWQRGIPLVVAGSHPEASASAELVLWNEGAAAAASTTLFLQVDGGLAGGQAAGEGMPLFLQRPFEAGVPLYARGPGEPASGGFALFVHSLPTAEDGVTLVVPVTDGDARAGVRLYTSGF